MNRIDLIRLIVRDKFKSGNLNFSLPENEILEYLYNYDLDRRVELSLLTPYTPFIDDGSYSKDRAFEKALYAYRHLPYPGLGMSFDLIYNLYLEDSKLYNYNRYHKLSNQAELNTHRGHYPDAMGKTAHHPTFSTDSPYSGYKNPYNPNGITGGTWGDNFYLLSNSLILNNWDINRTIDYLLEAEDNGVLLLMPDGSLPLLDNGDYYGGVLPNAEVIGKKKFEMGGLMEPEPSQDIMEEDLGQKKVYVAKYTGNVYNTREEALLDNYKYKNNPMYRYEVKSSKFLSPYTNYEIPYIPEKSITLTNAGLATGAILSTNMLDSIAEAATAAGLPIKTALGLVTKESTLGNPTSSLKDRAKISSADRYFLNLYLKAGKLPVMELFRGDTNIKGGSLININYLNPYASTIAYVASKAKTYEDRDRMLTEGETYADKMALLELNKPKMSYLQYGFEKYKNNPKGYNPGLSNYTLLVDLRANEVWGSPEIQQWYKDYTSRTGVKANGGNLYAEGDEIYTAAPSLYGIEITAQAPRIYNSYGLWYRINDLGLSVPIDESKFNFLGAHILPNNALEISKYKLYLAHNADVNHTNLFANTIRNIATATTLAPVAPEILTNPIINTLALAYGATEAPRNIREGIDNFKQGNYWSGIGDFGTAGLGILGGGILGYKGLQAANRIAGAGIPAYGLYREIGRTIPRTTPTLNGFYSSDLTGSGFVENVYTGSPLYEFGQTMRTSPEKAYFMRAPKDIDVLKLGNGRFRHEVVGNNIIPSGEVNGKFVSYGEPWQEFALGENSALYEFPIGSKRGPSLMATDWKGRPQKYSVDEVYDYMQKEGALNREFRKDVSKLGLDKLKGAERVKAYRALLEEKYPELLENYDTSIHGANQTVIPNERWNFDKFLKTPFWKYSENPISGQVQKELMMRWPEAKPLETPTISWQQATKPLYQQLFSSPERAGVSSKVITDPKDINFVLKLSRKGYTKEELLEALFKNTILNKYPFIQPTEYLLSIIGENGLFYPIWRLEKVIPYGREAIFGKDGKLLPKAEIEAARAKSNEAVQSILKAAQEQGLQVLNGRIITPEGLIQDFGEFHNVGFTKDGKPVIFDGLLNKFSFLSTPSTITPENTTLISPILSSNFEDFSELGLRELPINENSYYRAVDRNALDSYKLLGVISLEDVNGLFRSPYEAPMFTKGKPSEHRLNLNGLNTVWVVSKPDAKLDWESVKGAAMSPKVNGEFNKAPISNFDFYVYDPQKGYIKLDENLNLPGGIEVSRTPHIDYLKGLSKEQQIKYLTDNGLNDLWLWTLNNNPEHLESALARAPIPTTRNFINQFGKEVNLTPWGGTDLELLDLIPKYQKEVLKDYFSPLKKAQIQKTMGWGEKEYKELQDEILRSIGTLAEGEVKGVLNKFNPLAQHRGNVIGEGNTAKGHHIMTFNRDRIADENMAIEAVIHELGGHGKTVSMNPDKVSKLIKEAFPRLTQLMLKNQQLADEILEFNGRGKFFSLFKKGEDLEHYIVADKSLSKAKQQRLWSNYNRFRYINNDIQEKAARAYTGLLMLKLGFGNKTENINLLEYFFTPESVEAFKNAVLNYALPTTIGAGYLESQNKAYGGNIYDGTTEDNQQIHRPAFLDDVTYLPNEEYEFGVVADKPGKPKNKQFGQRVYAARHPRLTPEQWQEYWGNQGAAAVNNARDKFAKTVMPYALSFINPGGLLSTIGGIAGETTGLYLGEKLGGNTGLIIGGITGGILGGTPNLTIGNLARISNNIENRNRFFYLYLLPLSYEHPFKRGLSVAKHILTDDTPELWELAPKYKQLAPALYINPNRLDVPDDIVDALSGRFRDAAWRKYLGLPEKDPIYLDNGDGTFRYNLDYIKNLFDDIGLKMQPSGTSEPVISDFVTGNGGGVSNSLKKFGLGILSDANKTFGVHELSDMWDLQPFSRMTDTMGLRIIDGLKEAATYFYPKWIRPTKPGEKIGNFIFGKYDDKLRKILKPIDDRFKDFEAGPILGGKPFKMKTDVPFTKTATIDDKGMININIDYGLNAENILPQEALDWRRGVQSFPNINKPDYNIDLKNLTKSYGGNLFNGYGDSLEISPMSPVALRDSKLKEVPLPIITAFNLVLEDVRPSYSSLHDDQLWRQRREQRNQQTGQNIDEANKDLLLFLEGLNNAGDAVKNLPLEMYATNLDAAQKQELARIKKALEDKKIIEGLMTLASLYSGYGATKRGVLEIAKRIAKPGTNAAYRVESALSNMDLDQILYSSAGALANSYLLFKGGNNVENVWNGTLLGLDANGILGGSNYFKRFGKIGTAVDNVMDFLGGIGGVTDLGEGLVGGYNLINGTDENE